MVCWLCTYGCALSSCHGENAKKTIVKTDLLKIIGVRARKIKNESYEHSPSIRLGEFFDNEAMASIMKSKKEKSPKTNYGLGPS